MARYLTLGLRNGRLAVVEENVEMDKCPKEECCKRPTTDDVLEAACARLVDEIGGPCDPDRINALTELVAVFCRPRWE